MSELKDEFEKDLKTKLLLKTAKNTPEEIELLRAFKFYDVTQQNTCNLDQFSQALEKLGIFGYEDKKLSQIFNYYSGGKKELNYKDFISEVYNKSSKQKQEEEEQNEEDDPVEGIILKLREKLSTGGLLNLMSIESGFRALDPENEQMFDYEKFVKACENFGFNLSEEESKLLFDAFNREESGKLNYDEFIRVLRGELSDNRKGLVHNLFKTVDNEKKGVLSLDELFEKYVAKGSYEYIYKKMDEKEAMKVFVDSLKINHLYLNGEDDFNKPIDLDEFEDYYESVSLMIADDDIFKEVLLKSWGLIPIEEEKEKEKKETTENRPKENVEKENITELPPKEEKYEEKVEKEQTQPEQEETSKEPESVVEKQNEESEQQQRVEVAEEEKPLEESEQNNLVNTENIQNFREILGGRGVFAVINFLNQLRQYDRKGNKELNYTDFADALYNSNLNISEQDIKNLFNDFVQMNNTINYQEFLSALVGNLNQRRYNIVEAAFNRIDVEKCGVVNLSEVKQLFNSKNSPLVREGITTEEEFYNTFMETFQTHHNIFRSAKIKKVNFDEFLDYYKYVSITIEDDYLFEEMLIMAFKLSKPKLSDIGRKDNVKNILTNPLETFNAEAAGRNITLDKANRTAKKCFPQNVGSVPYGIDNDTTDYSNLLHPKGDLNGIRLNKIDDPLTVFRKKIAARGTRGIMSLRRTFMLYDENKNNKLSEKEFHKYIEDYRIDISEENEKKLFKSFDKNNSGDIDYKEFVDTLVGNLNDFRYRIVEKVFDKLDKEKKGKISFDTVRNSYNPCKHPEVLNGSRNADEVLGRFIDFFEYHFGLLNPSKDNEDVTKEEFVEFYKYVSLLFDDDKYFENVMSRVWGLGNIENYGKISKNVYRKGIL